MGETYTSRMPDTSSFHVYRYRLRPLRPDQEALAIQALGNSRWVYNRIVAINRDLARLGVGATSGVEAINLLPEWKLAQEWLTLGPSQPLQQALIDYAQAQTAHRQAPGQYSPPTFKTRHDMDASLRFPHPQAADWNRQEGWINLPKLGQFRYFKDPRLPQGTLKQVTLVREGERWMVCLCVEQSTAMRKAQKLHALPPHPTGLTDSEIAGIDLGQVHAATDHHGQHYDFPMERVNELDEDIARVQVIISHKREAGKALCKHQKDQAAKASKATKATKYDSITEPSVVPLLDRPQQSRRMKRARACLRKLQTKRRDLLADARHQLSHRLTEAFPVLGVEDLAMKKLMKNATRTANTTAVEPPVDGSEIWRKVKSTNHGPTKSMPPRKPLHRAREKALHRGWAILGPGIFVSQLQYKAALKGGVVVKVNPAYTSQTCPTCLHIDTNNRESQAVFRCTACGYEDHADKVGALNVRTRAMETLMTQGFPQPQPPKHRRPRNPRKPKSQPAQAG